MAKKEKPPKDEPEAVDGELPEGAEAPPANVA